MKLVMDFYNSSFFNSETRNAEFKNKNSGYPFVAFLVYGINPDKHMSNSLTDFVKFWESFSRTLSNFSVWNKSEKKLGEFINEVLKYLFSYKNKYQSYLYIGENCIIIENLKKAALISKGDVKYKSAYISEFYTKNKELYAITSKNSDVKITTITYDKNENRKKINTVNKIKTIKTAEDYISLFKSIAANIDKSINVPCPLCAREKIKKNKSPKKCPKCTQAIEQLAKMKFILENYDEILASPIFDIEKNEKYKKIKIRFYDRIKKAVDGGYIKKRKEKFIFPLIEEYTKFQAKNPKIREYLSKNYTLEEIIEAWN